ncbi:MAG TPA: hypothetical protein VGH03_22505 [Caulobacteraceae bacterium]|jgi:hypothetical protein
MARWFGVKGLYRWYNKATGQTLNVEERVVLYAASDHDEALSLAEADASKYCSADPSTNFAIEPIGWWDSYEIGEVEINAGIEIHSRLLDKSLSSDASFA